MELIPQLHSLRNTSLAHLVAHTEGQIAELNLSAFAEENSLEFVQFDFAGVRDFESLIPEIKALSEGNKLVQFKNLGALKPCDQFFVLSNSYTANETNFCLSTQSREACDNLHVEMHDMVLCRLNIQQL